MRLMLLLVLFAASCTDEPRSYSTLLAHGFKDIRLTGWRAYACGRDDAFTTGFVATNQAGQQVGGVVCCGVMKGCTVRF